MGAKTGITWATSTFNPWWGCTKVSPGCDHCYAEGTARRWGTQWGANAVRRTFGDKHWNEPRAWNAKAARDRKPWRVFVASMADVFDKDAPPGARLRLFGLIRETPALTWMILTKRIGNAGRMLMETAHEAMAAQDFVLSNWLFSWVLNGHPPAHVWLGATIVNQEEYNRDVAKLRAIPARVHFLSCEPLLGAIVTDLPRPDEDGHCVRCGLPYEEQRDSEHHVCPPGFGGSIDWIIVGGESGVSARPMHPTWATTLRDQCAAANVAFFFKQWGEWAPLSDQVPLETKALADRCRVVHEHPNDMGGTWMVPVGKLRAGELLDEREHKAFPC